MIAVVFILFFALVAAWLLAPRPGEVKAARPAKAPAIALAETVNALASAPQS